MTNRYNILNKNKAQIRKKDVQPTRKTGKKCR